MNEPNEAAHRTAEPLALDVAGTPLVVTAPSRAAVDRVVLGIMNHDVSLTMTGFLDCLGPDDAETIKRRVCNAKDSLEYSDLHSASEQISRHFGYV